MSGQPNPDPLDTEIRHFFVGQDMADARRHLAEAQRDQPVVGALVSGFCVWHPNCDEGDIARFFEEGIDREVVSIAEEIDSALWEGRRPNCTDGEWRRLAAELDRLRKAAQR